MQITQLSEDGLARAGPSGSANQTLGRGFQLRSTPRYAPELLCIKFTRKAQTLRFAWLLKVNSDFTHISIGF